MKKMILGLILIVSSSLYADQYVNGYTKNNGTYVQGHMKSSPNSSTYDNFSTKGNTNPYTGEKGYKDPTPNYGSSSSSSSSKANRGY